MLLRRSGKPEKNPLISDTALVGVDGELNSGVDGGSGAGRVGIGRSNLGDESGSGVSYTVTGRSRSIFGGEGDLDTLPEVTVGCLKKGFLTCRGGEVGPTVSGRR